MDLILEPIEEKRIKEIYKKYIRINSSKILISKFSVKLKSSTLNDNEKIKTNRG